MQRLPIDSHLEDIRQAIASNPITIVEASPGSGKTTRVAPFLLSHLESTSPIQRMYLLQPRRLAAKSVAERIAFEHGSDIGSRIGYQVRFDNQVSRNTRLIVATEGILLRRLQEDPAIEDTYAVFLDEFHERSLDGDLLFGMLRRVQQSLRDDLRIVIMSATIDTEMMRSLLGDVPIVKVDSRCFPVQTRFRPLVAPTKLVDHVVDTIVDVVPKHEGDVLTFLPGAGEIHRVAEQLSRSSMARDCDIVSLYGSMPLEEQTKAIETSDKRKIVLATNVAESSLTIEGVRVVIDSGQARVMRFASDIGLDRLSLENISQASATQRAGRAGRVAPGVCYRLWSEAADRSRPGFLEPEIRRIDLANAVLQLYAWGEGESQDFPWLEPPRPESYATSKVLLEQLGAIREGRITSIGKQMVRLPIHPRLARMVMEAVSWDCLPQASLMAAMLSERDPFDRREQRNRGSSLQTSSHQRWDSDCLEKLNYIESFLARRSDGSTPFGQLQSAAVRSIKNVADQIADQARALLKSGSNANKSISKEEGLMRCLLAGFPDRLARRRGIGKNIGLMVGGKGVALSPQSGVTECEYFLCIEVDAGRGDAVVRQASKVEPDWLLSGLVTSEELFFHPTQKQIVARRQTRWLDLVLQETPTNITDNKKASQLLYQAVIQLWDTTYPKDNEALSLFIERTRCLREWVPELELPELNQDVLHSVAEQLCDGKRSLAEVRDGAWLDWLQSRFTNEQLQAIEREAPSRLTIPSGNSIRLTYELGKPPVLAVKIQEMFSCKATPRIARGRVPVLLHLLSPAMRPQQITDDLASFWANGYSEVKKELKRRYPKHSWPDDPITASPHTRPRRDPKT